MKALQFDKRRNRVKECPCGKSNKDGKFVPYIGYENKGFCHSCRTTFPVDIEKPINIERPTYGNTEKHEQSPTYINTDVVQLSKGHYERNLFICWLVGLFGETKAKELCNTFRIGTYNYSTEKTYTDANIFWYFDISGNCRTGKIMFYNPDGHRSKLIKPDWVHSVLRIENFNKVICFFGEHLINIPTNLNKSIGIVESEKSAIIASFYFPKIVWIASGGATGLTKKKIEALKNRDVILFPDLGKYELWCKESEKFICISNSIKVSAYLERNAPEEDKELGFDIADYLLKDKQRAEEISSIAVTIKEPETDDFQFYETTQINERENLEALSEISEIECQLNNLVLPTGFVQIDNNAKTDNINFCIERALYNAKQSVGVPHIGRECLNRLRRIRKALTNE